MAKLLEAEARLFRRIWICRRCKAKVKVDTDKILSGKIKCKKCGGKSLRPKKKERRKGATK